MDFDTEDMLVEDINDWMNDHHGLAGFSNAFVSSRQRREQMDLQRQHIGQNQEAIAELRRGQERMHSELMEATRNQTFELQKANGIEAGREAIERQRLELEKLRLEAEQAEREDLRMRADHIKTLRGWLLDNMYFLEQLRKHHPVI